MPPTKPKGGKMMSLINYRLRITLNDSRQIVGQLLAFDAHMNLVLADSQEYRKIKSRKAKARAAAAAEAGKATAEDDEDDDAAMAGAADAVLEQKRTLGLLILRGEHIVSMAIEAPPPADDRTQPTMQPGPGKGAPMGRGMGLAVPPMAGAPPPMMGRPMPYARGPPPGFPVAPPGGFPPRPPPGFGMPPRPQ
ncbi:hypothetical protein PANT_13d00005 [Moesziomyces antarcticus T-34]|uniref:Sm protein B n=1 Tax=Pseudozyma antarctica (strain T-34) TaxID=1151754 RepID=M9LWN6_PSEA3|nr:hypothetical protein PANT_13d00005 [Moesziomyces antarcticus T-34]